MSLTNHTFNLALLDKKQFTSGSIPHVDGLRFKDLQDLRQQVSQIFSVENKDFDIGFQDAVQSIGLKILAKYLNELINFHQETNASHTFQVILTDVKNPNALLDRNELEFTYLNLPVKDVIFKVNNNQLRFAWHQKRAVNLTTALLTLPKFQHHHQVKNPENLPEAERANFYLYLYYDPIESKDLDGDSACNIYFYSRECGRFIKKIGAATLLGMNQSGSTYSQGMRIVVDDCNGELKLSPNKNEFSFSTAEDQILEANLYAWVRAKFIETWDHDKSFFFDTTAMTKAINSHYDDVKTAIETGKRPDDSVFHELNDTEDDVTGEFNVRQLTSNKINKPITARGGKSTDRKMISVIKKSIQLTRKQNVYKYMVWTIHDENPETAAKIANRKPQTAKKKNYLKQPVPLSRRWTRRESRSWRNKQKNFKRSWRNLKKSSRERPKS